MGLFLGWASGGDYRRLGGVTWRWGWLALVLFVIQGVARGRLLGVAGLASVGTVAWAACSLALTALLLAERQSPGMFMAAVGIMLNLLVVLLNGSMPAAVMSVGHSEAAALNAAQQAFYQPVDQQTLWRVLGDILPLPSMGGLTLLSVGDVLLVIGVSVWVMDTMMTSGKMPASAQSVEMRSN